MNFNKNLFWTNNQNLDQTNKKSNKLLFSYLIDVNYKNPLKINKLDKDMTFYRNRIQKSQINLEKKQNQIKIKEMLIKSFQKRTLSLNKINKSPNNNIPYSFRTSENEIDKLKKKYSNLQSRQKSIIKQIDSLRKEKDIYLENFSKKMNKLDY